MIAFDNLVDEIASEGGSIDGIELAERIAVVSDDACAAYGEPYETVVVDTYMVDKIARKSFGHTDMAHDMALPIIARSTGREGDKEQENRREKGAYG